jgi:hypothetical protein
MIFHRIVLSHLHGFPLNWFIVAAKAPASSIDIFDGWNQWPRGLTRFSSLLRRCWLNYSIISKKQKHTEIGNCTLFVMSWTIESIWIVCFPQPHRMLMESCAIRGWSVPFSIIHELDIIIQSQETNPGWSVSMLLPQCEPLNGVSSITWFVLPASVLWTCSIHLHFGTSEQQLSLCKTNGEVRSLETKSVNKQGRLKFGNKQML